MISDKRTLKEILDSPASKFFPPGPDGKRCEGIPGVVFILRSLAGVKAVELGVKAVVDLAQLPLPGLDLLVDSFSDACHVDDFSALRFPRPARPRIFMGKAGVRPSFCSCRIFLRWPGCLALELQYVGTRDTVSTPYS